MGTNGTFDGISVYRLDRHGKVYQHEVTDVQLRDPVSGMGGEGRRGDWWEPAHSHVPCDSKNGMVQRSGQVREFLLPRGAASVTRWSTA